MTHKEITKLLQDEMQLVTGCTGPTAYALASSACREYVTGSIKSIKVSVSPAYLKMGFGVATPGTAKTGIEIATAAGYIGGNPKLGMQVLKDTTDEDIRLATEMVESGVIEVTSAPGKKGVYVRTEIDTDKEIVCATVSGTHDGLSSVDVNGKRMFCGDPRAYEERIEDHPESLSLDDIFKYVETCSLEEVGFLIDDYKKNLELAVDGIRNGLGLKTGRALLNKEYRGKNGPIDLMENPLKYLPKDLEKRVTILVSGASDGRMGGSRFPAVAAMGDGNQGLTLLIPIGEAGNHLGKSNLETARAMALGALMLFYVKMHIGRAAAMCLCAIAAASGVAAGYGFLMGLSEQEIRAAVKNVISPLAGMLCDGAKNACAFKMSIATSMAMRAVEISAEGVEAGYYDGVTGETLEDTVRTITTIANETMDMMDESMVRAILDKERKNHR